MRLLVPRSVPLTRSPRWRGVVRYTIIHIQLQTQVDYTRLPDIIGSSWHKAVECCLGRAWWFPFLEIPTSYLQLSSGLPFVIINKTIFKKMITIGYGCKVQMQQSSRSLINKPLARMSLKSWHLPDRWTPSRLFQYQQKLF